MTRNMTEQIAAARSPNETQQASQISALRTLNDLSSRLWRTPNLQAGLDEMLAATVQMLGADFGNIQLFDAERELLTIEAQSGFQQAFLDYFREVSAAGGSTCGRALRSGERIIVEDIEIDAAYAPMRDIGRAADYRGLQSTPLIGHDGTPLGMIPTFWRAPHQPDEQTLAALDLYARQAADFIERTQAQSMRESQDAFLLSLSDELRSLTAPKEIGWMAAERLGEYFGVNRVFYAEIVGTVMTIERDYTRGVHSIVGAHDLAGLGPEMVAEYGGEAALITMRNVNTDPRPHELGRGGLHERQIGAFMDVVLFDEAQCVSILATQSAAPRDWTRADQRLVQAVAERARAAIERARAEQAANERQEQVQAARNYAEAILRTSTVPLLVLEDDLRVATANEAFYRTFQVDPDTTEGYKIYALGNHQWDIPELRRLLEEILPHNEAFEAFEVNHAFETIGHRFMRLNGRQLAAQSGEPERIVLVIEDVTEQRQAERLREQQSRLLELIATGVPLDECLEALCRVVSHVGSGVRASILMADEARQAFQRPIAPELHASWGEGLAGAPINDLMIGTCGEAVFRGQPVTCEDVTTDERWSAEWRALCRANGVRASYSVPVCDEAGEPAASFMLCFDRARRPSAWEQELAEFGSHVASIALARVRSHEAQRQAEARQRSQKQAFEAAVNDAPLAESLDILLRNAMAQIPGEPRGAFYMADDEGMHLHAIPVESGISEAYTDAVDGLEIGADSLACGLAVHENQPILTADVFEEPRWAHMRHLAAEHDFRGCWSFPIHTAAGQAMGTFAIYHRQPREATRRDVAVANVVTQAASIIIARHQEVAERRRVEHALHTANRRKDEFLATLAHELRNPMAPLRNGLAVMRKNDPRTTAKAQAIMERQLGQLTHLVDDLMDISRITRGKVELRLAATDLAAVVRDAVETTRPRMDTAGHTLRTALPAEAVTLQADAERLTQVLTNLLTNAAKYTPEGGEIDIGLERYDDTAVVCVRDNGMGIDADQLGAVFDVFTQNGTLEGHTSEGLGIGLSLVKQLVELHGGTVAAHSDGAGQGSEFSMRLPLGVDKPEQTSDKTPTASASGVLRLLVVDDNPDVADSMKLLLDSLGHEVQVAYDGYQALDAIAAFQPDAVFLDIGLPGIDGFETAKRLRATPEGKDVTLIALTGWGREEDHSRTTEAGFDHHLVKPVEPDALEQLLAEIKAQDSSG